MNTIIIEASARHVHLSEKNLQTLFGGAELTNKRELSQPGQWLTEEKVTLVGPKGKIERVSVLGPTRPATQVEISYTDARVLGVMPPVRQSGEVAGSTAITLVGPCGEVELAEGCMIAKRHIHMIPETAAKMGLSDGQIVTVKVPGERGLCFCETVVRVSDKFADRMHIDYDEANAAGLTGEVVGEILL